jgi:tetratricopeptide (TPR) repeat protein
LKSPRTFEDYDAICAEKAFSKRITIHSNIIFERPSENAALLKEIKHACQQAIYLDKNSPFAYINMAIVNAAQGSHDFALIDLDTALQINPKIYWAYLEKGEVFSTMKNPNTAIENYTKAIDLNPNFAKAFLARGKAFQGSKSYELAVSDYTRFLSLDGKSRNACSVFKNRARIFEITGNRDKMIADQKSASDLESLLGIYCVGNF